MANTGFKAWTTLEQYNPTTGLATGVTKPNVSGDPHYVAPIQDLGACPTLAPYIAVSITTIPQFAYINAFSANVTVTSTYPWNVSTKPSWITCSPDSGSGNLSMTVFPSNNTGSARSGTITLVSGTASATINVSQAAYVANSIVVSPTSLSFSAASEMRSFGVTSNIAWTVTDNQSWITVSGASGSGSDPTVNVTCTANTGGARTGTVTVSGGGITKTVSITQAAANQTLSVSPTTINVPGIGGSYTITVTSNTTWTVVNSDVNFMLISTISGSGNASLNLSVNSSRNNRSGTLTFSTPNGTSVVVTITQTVI